MTPAGGWELLAAAYIAADSAQFEGEQVEVVIPARGDRPAYTMRGGLSAAVVHQPGEYVNRLLHAGTDLLCPTLLTVEVPLVQLFVGGDVDFVTPGHLMRVQAVPTRPRIAPRRPAS